MGADENGSALKAVAILVRPNSNAALRIGTTAARGSAGVAPATVIAAFNWSRKTLRSTMSSAGQIRSSGTGVWVKSKARSGPAAPEGRRCRIDDLHLVVLELCNRQRALVGAVWKQAEDACGTRKTGRPRQR